MYDKSHNAFIFITGGCGILQVCDRVWYKRGAGRSVALGGGGVRLQLRVEAGAPSHACGGSMPCPQVSSASHSHEFPLLTIV